jgi:hypothetical protein
MLEGLLLTLDVLAMLILMRWSMVQDRAQKKNAVTTGLAAPSVRRRRP